jgi:hypothetical protein
LAGLLHAIETYRQFLANGKRFTILTDNCSLKFIQNLKHSSSPKLIRYSLLLQHLNFNVVHIKGSTNIVPDFLSRYPFKENEDTKEPQTPAANSLLDVDHYNFVTAIDVYQVCEDSQIERRNEDERRRRNFKIYELAPISTAKTSNENQTDSSNQQRKGNRQRTNANKRK